MDPGWAGVGGGHIPAGSRVLGGWWGPGRGKDFSEACADSASSEVESLISQRGQRPIKQKDIAAAAAPGGSSSSTTAPSVMSSVVNAAKTAASTIAGAVGAESTAKALKPDAAAGSQEGV